MCNLYLNDTEKSFFKQSAYNEIVKVGVFQEMLFTLKWHQHKVVLTKYRRKPLECRLHLNKNSRIDLFAPAMRKHKQIRTNTND